MISEISGGLLACVRAAAYALLLFTPGIWIACGLEVSAGIPLWVRICTAITLSPLVVCIEFYAIRLMGCPFSTTAVLLAVINLPALYLIWIRRGKLASLDRGAWLVGAASVVIPVICLAGLLAIPSARLAAPHGWYHADAAYMLARGDLDLESPTLAGMRLSYPAWLPLVSPAVQSYLAEAPPVSSYIWSDLVWLMVYFGFAAGIAKEMGGGRLAQVGSGIWLLLGTTPVGYLLMLKWKPGEVLGYCCDARNVEAFTKFQIFGPMALGLAMFMALIYFLIRPGPLTAGRLAVIFLLLSGIGLLYPLLFPPACCVIGGRALAILLSRQKGKWPAVRKEWPIWAAFVLVAGVLTYGEVKFLTLNRQAAESAVSLSEKSFAARKLAAALIVTSLLLGGWIFAVRGCWKSWRIATATLSIGAAASYVLYAFMHIPYYDNEYKFVFSAAMCLAVFSGIAVERIWREWPRQTALPALAAIAILVIGTYGYYAWVNWPASWMLARPAGAPPMERTPRLDTGGFYLRLDSREPLSDLCDSVSRKTPAESILLVDDGSLYYPGLTARSLYVSLPNRLFRGINVFSDALDADLRGYGREILARRRATMARLFDADDCCRADALNSIFELKRPVAIITEPRHAALAQWLKNLKGAEQLYAKDDLALWLIKPGPR